MKIIPKFEIYKKNLHNFLPQLKIYHSKGKWRWKVMKVKQSWEIYETFKGREAIYIELEKIKTYKDRIDSIRENGERYASVDLNIPAIVFPISHTKNKSYKIFDGKHRYKKSVELGLNSLLSYVCNQNDAYHIYQGAEDTFEQANLFAVRILTMLVQKHDIT
tara:strand:- start:1235 stop:1720 length:486 start_codon:yes stop_codon:yes gene_type:complete